MKTFTSTDLNERVTISRETTTDDGFGGVTTAEEEIVTRWANVYAPKAQAREIAGQDGVTVNYEVTIRSDLTIEYDDIITWHSERMRVKDFRLIQDRQFLSILCETER